MFSMKVQVNTFTFCFFAFILIEYFFVKYKMIQSKIIFHLQVSQEECMEMRKHVNISSPN